MTPPMLLVLLGFTEVIHSQRVVDNKNKLYMTTQNIMITADLPRKTKSTSISNDTLCHTGFGCFLTCVEKRTKVQAGEECPVTIILSLHVEWDTKQGTQTRQGD